MSDGVVEELLLGVGGAEFEVVDGELGLQGEQRRLAVGGGGLRLLAGGVDAAADGAPEIDLIVQIEREDEVGVSVVGVGGVEVGLVGGVAHAADEGVGAECGEEVGALDADAGAGGAEVGVGDLEGLIGGGDLWLERVQAGVVEEGPPVAARDGVGGRGGLPVGVGLFEGRSRGGSGDLVVGADHAAGEDWEEEEQRQLRTQRSPRYAKVRKGRRRLGVGNHWPHWPPEGWSLIWTDWPSARESEGSRMT